MHLRLIPCLLLAMIANIRCDGNVCSFSFCKPHQYCLMKSLPCDNVTCPEVPRCISHEHVCSTSFPYRAENSAVMQCSDMSNECPVGYKCESGYCCINQDQLDSADDVIENLEENDEDGSDILTNIFGHINVDSAQGCKPCKMDSCNFVPCVYPEPVRCVPDNCSCMATYKDLKGRHVECGIPDDGVIPIVPDFLGQDIPPLDVVKALDQTNITNDKATVEPTIGVTVPMTTTEKKLPTPRTLVTASSTEVEVLTLQTSDNENRKNTTAIYVTVGVLVLLTIAIVGYAVYKIYTAKITRQSPELEKDTNDVKVPLKEVTTHNNNDVKVSEKLMNAHPTSDNR